jgi:predicted acetyltransferase
MSEIRTTYESECEEYLSVLCSAFDLDADRARSAFFSEPYFDLGRKWIYYSEGKIISILTVVPMNFGDGDGIGIAGVATLPEYRDKGIARDLLNYVFGHYEKRGLGRALLFARNASLYLKAGFTQLDEVYVQPLPPGRSLKPRQLEQDEVRAMYDNWAAADDRRMRRDDARWKYWNWTFKTPLAMDEGYFCYESNRIRELLPNFTRLPTSDLVDFYGTRALARDLGITIDNAPIDLLLMGRGFDYIPRMFMTDQF